MDLNEIKEVSPYPPAIIFGLEHPRAVAAISSLGSLGVPIIGVDYRGSPRARASRYLKRTHLAGPDVGSALPFLSSLDSGGVLIPTSDEYLMLVSQHHDELSRRFRLTVPPWKVLGPLMDIRRCYTLGNECGIKTPRIFKPSDLEDLRTTIAELNLDQSHYLLKTPLGDVPADPKSGRFTKPAGSDASAIEANCVEIHSRLGDYPFIVEVIPGEADQCIGVSMVVGANHEPLAVHCIRRLTLYTYAKDGALQHPYELGANVYCETTHDDEALEAAKALVRHARYVGAITVEFRRDPRDGSLVLIKADPRLVRATGLSRTIGQDLPIALYRSALGLPVERLAPYLDGVGWLWLVPYVKSLWLQRGNGPVLRKLLALLWRAPRLRSLAFWGRRDPMPLVLDVLLGVREAFLLGLRRLTHRRA